jgi:hypothetical protein
MSTEPAPMLLADENREELATLELRMSTSPRRGYRCRWCGRGLGPFKMMEQCGRTECEQQWAYYLARAERWREEAWASALCPLSPRYMADGVGGSEFRLRSTHYEEAASRLYSRHAPARSR